MNGSEPKIEIFKPFSEAFELTKMILFQPFDLTKWLAIGFAAFLAKLSGGFGFNPGVNWDQKQWQSWPTSDWISSLHQTPLWTLVLVVVAVGIFFVAFIMVLMWVGARGRFIFTDCIVKDRGAIVAPWREFRKEANSFFLLSFLVALSFFLVAALFALAILVPTIRHGTSTEPLGVFTISGIIFVALVVFLLAMAWALISHFMVPVMYRRRCCAREAFSVVTALIRRYPGEMVLYCLFLFALALAVVMIGCVAVCATCCIAAIPYVGTVILLPVFVCLRAFGLLFLRQFGTDYDVWAGIPQPEPPPISSPPPLPMPPPLQT